jgi:hypothetical protein
MEHDFMILFWIFLMLITSFFSGFFMAKAIYKKENEKLIRYLKQEQLNTKIYETNDESDN